MTIDFNHQLREFQTFLGERFETPKWADDLFLLGSILDLSVKDQGTINHVVISLPTSEMAATFLICGMIDSYVQNLNLQEGLSEIKCDQLVEGMHIQANSKMNPQKFSGVVENIDLNNPYVGRITLRIQNQPKVLRADLLENIHVVDYLGNAKNQVGYWDPYEKAGQLKSPWDILGVLDSAYLSQIVEPFCCLHAPKEKIQDELGSFLSVTVEEEEILIPVRDFLAPVGDGRIAPFFLEINPTKSNSNHEDKNYNFESQVLFGSKAIIENFESPKSNNVISIIGRNEMAALSTSEMILERYSGGTDFHVDGLTEISHPAIEVLTFGVLK